MSSKTQMRRKKALLGVLILTLSFAYLSTIMPAHAAADHVIAYYDYANITGPTYISDSHPTSGAATSAIGQFFNTSEAEGYLTQIDFKMSKVNNPDCNLTVQVWTYDTGANEPDTFLEESYNQIEATDITASATIYSFYFNQTLLLEDDTIYCFFVYADDEVLLGDPNYVGVYLDNSGSYSYGYYFKYGSSAWSETSGYDLCFYIYGNVDSAAEEEPDPWYEDENIAGLMSYIVALGLMLTPMGIMYGVKLRSPNVLIIGLLIGAGLAYMVFPTVVPLWLVFGITLGIIGYLIFGRQ